MLIIISLLLTLYRNSQIISEFCFCPLILVSPRISVYSFSSSCCQPRALPSILFEVLHRCWGLFCKDRKYAKYYILISDSISYSIHSQKSLLSFIQTDADVEVINSVGCGTAFPTHLNTLVTSMSVFVSPNR